jgi:outer membrane protein assembly factor BamA
MRVAGLIPVLAILFTLALVPTLRAQERLGTEVLSVEIEGAPGSMLEGLPVQSGTILTREVLRTAIQALYDRGGYGRIEVEGVALPGGGTRLIFHVDDPYFFGTVRIQPRGLLERPLSSYLTLPYGQRFSLGELDRIRIAVIAELASEGYFDAGVTPVYTQDPDSRLVSVVFDTVAGPPAEVGRVEFDGGEQTFGIDELADAFDVRAAIQLGSRPGRGGEPAGPVCRVSGPGRLSRHRGRGGSGLESGEQHGGSPSGHRPGSLHLRRRSRFRPVR